MTAPTAAGPWRMFAGRPTDSGRMHVFADPRTVRAYGDGHRMVQPHWALFSMQFPYGPEAAQDAGQGVIVRLTVADAADAAGAG